MALKDTIIQMRELFASLARDLEKATGGNCAAAQRVRTGTIKLAGIAKMFRKESVAAEKGTRKKAPPKAVRKKSVKK